LWILWRSFAERGGQVAGGWPEWLLLGPLETAPGVGRSTAFSGWIAVLEQEALVNSDVLCARENIGLHLAFQLHELLAIEPGAMGEKTPLADL
jgi:hypothetical protein